MSPVSQTFPTELLELIATQCDKPSLLPFAEVSQSCLSLSRRIHFSSPIVLDGCNERQVARLLQLLQNPHSTLPYYLANLFIGHPQLHPDDEHRSSHGPCHCVTILQALIRLGGNLKLDQLHVGLCTNRPSRRAVLELVTQLRPTLRSLKFSSNVISDTTMETWIDNFTPVLRFASRNQKLASLTLDGHIIFSWDSIGVAQDARRCRNTPASLSPRTPAMEAVPLPLALKELTLNAFPTHHNHIPTWLFSSHNPVRLTSLTLGHSAGTELLRPVLQAYFNHPSASSELESLKFEWHPSWTWSYDLSNLTALKHFSTRTVVAGRGHGLSSIANMVASTKGTSARLRLDIEVGIILDSAEYNASLKESFNHLDSAIYSRHRNCEAYGRGFESVNILISRHLSRTQDFPFWFPACLQQRRFLFSLAPTAQSGEVKAPRPARDCGGKRQLLEATGVGAACMGLLWGVGKKYLPS